MTVVRESRTRVSASGRAPAGLSLPEGRWHGGLWVTDRKLELPDRYGHCVAEYERTGLWPVLVPRDSRFEASGADWIDDRGWLSPSQELVDELSPARVLQQWWPGDCCDGACLAPYGATFAGLARPVRSRTDRLANAGNTGVLLATRDSYRLGLVRVDRPADIPASLGWAGMINATGDVAAVSSVLRSWEERFSAVLVTLGFDLLELAVAAPPQAGAHALAVAAEHLRQRRTWHFRWN